MSTPASLVLNVTVSDNEGLGVWTFDMLKATRLRAHAVCLPSVPGVFLQSIGVFPQSG